MARERQQSPSPTSRINLADCLADDKVRLTLGFGADFQNYGLEIWAGNGCEVKANRLGPTATCWPIYHGQPDDSIFTAEFGVRDFLAGRTRAADVGNLDGASCEPANADLLPQFLNAYVMLMDANADPAAQATWRAEYRLVGSPPPDDIVAGVGDRKVWLGFRYDNLETVAASVQFFCDPPPNDPDAIAKGALVSRDPGAAEQVCSNSKELVAGEPAASLEHLRCGSARATDTRGVAAGLVNGVLYNVAAATVDTFGNVGALSYTVCGSPLAIPAGDTKVEACSFAGTSPMGRGSALAFVVVLGSALARRRRS